MGRVLSKLNCTVRRDPPTEPGSNSKSRAKNTSPGKCSSQSNQENDGPLIAGQKPSEALSSGLESNQATLPKPAVNREEPQHSASEIETAPNLSRNPAEQLETVGSVSSETEGTRLSSTINDLSQVEKLPGVPDANNGVETSRDLLNEVPRDPIPEVPRAPGHDQRYSASWSQALEKLKKDKAVEWDSDSDFESNIDLIASLMGEVKSQKEKFDKGRWQYTDSDGKQKIYAATFLEHIERYSAIGTLAVQKSPEIVGLVWCSLQILIEIGLSFERNMALIDSSLEYIGGIMCCSEIYEQLYCHYEHNSVDMLKGDLVDQYASLMKYLLYVKKKLKQRKTEQIFKSLAAEFSSALEEVKTWSAKVASSADMAEKAVSSKARFDQQARDKVLKEHLIQMKTWMKRIEDGVDRLGSKLKDLWKSVEKDRFYETLDWVSAVPFGHIHRTHKDNQLDGVGDWLYQHSSYQAWLKTTPASNVIWLHGASGTGKTMLASKVIESLLSKKRTGHAVAYFYCRYNESNRCKPETVLQAILRQLCIAYSNPGSVEHKLPISLTDLRNEALTKSMGPPSLRDCCNIIKELSENFGRIYIVIDALDECSSNSRTELLDILSDLVRSCKDVRMFITGQDTSDIGSVLSLPSAFCIQSRGTDNDIRLYIKSEVQKMCREDKNLESLVKQQREKDIIEGLEKDSNGVFMWVRLRMQAVRLETTVEGMIQALTSFPKGLSAAYTKLLEKMENENTVEHDAAMAVIKWLVYSCVECSPDTVIQALQIKTSTIEAFEGIRGLELSRLLEICRNLVFFDQETRVIHLPHGSLKQYLQTPSNYDHWKPDEVRSWIAELCLQVLMSDEYQKHQALDCPAPQLRAYAVFNWAEYLRQTQKRSDALNDLWKGFLNINNEQYCRWAIQIRMTHSVLTGKENRPISPLWTACLYQLYDVFKALLADGADPNCHNSSGQALAHYCIQNGLDDFLNRLIDTIKISNAAGTEVDQASNVEGTTTVEKYESVRRSDLHPSFDVNAADSQGRTALFHASLLGNESIVQRLLGTKMCEVNLRDQNGDNPLLIVASTGNIFIMKHLLAQDSLELNQKNEEGDTALLLATRLGFEGFVETFLQLAAHRYQRREGSAEQSIDPAGSKMTLKITSDLQLDINCTDDLNRTPLMKTVEINNLNLVKILLKEEGLDLGVKSQYGFTALSYAAWNGYTKIIEAMLGSDKVLQQHLEFKDEDGFTPLALAAWCGYSEIVKLLLEKGADVNTRDNCGCTPLRLASYRGMQEVVKEILQRKDVDFKTTNDAETTPLKSATEGGYSDIIGDLLRKFITEDETDFKDEDGNNLLLLASIHGQTEVVKLLLLDKRCSDLKYVNKGGLTALEGAIKGGHTEIIRLLCESNADIEGFESYGSVMLSLAQNGPFSLFKSLLELNSDDKLEVRDEEGNDVLMRATIGGNEDIVKLLLDQRKYDPNVPNREGLTALHIASAAKHWQILKLLHTKGAGMDSTKGLLAAALDGKNEIFQMLLEDYDDKEVLDHKDEDGDTVLLLAAIGGNVEIMRSLLNPHRCEIDYANMRGETALTLAISHRHPEVANLLLDRGVKRNISKINGWTPLHLAASTGDQNLIRRLLSYDDVDPKALTRHGSTPLLVAAETGVPEVVKLLLEKYEPGIEIPDMDEDGEMVFQAAAYSGSKETVDILLDHGKGNINHLNKAGETALIMAVTQGHKEVVQSLLGTEGIDVAIKNSHDESAFDIANYKAMIWGEEGQHSEILTLLTAFADKSLSNGS